MNERFVLERVLGLQVLVAQPGRIERYADFVEDIGSKAFLGVARFGLGDLRFLLGSVGDLQLVVDDVDPARILGNVSKRLRGEGDEMYHLEGVVDDLYEYREYRLERIRTSTLR